MATGGTWTTMNKIRPGAYLNVGIAPSTNLQTGVRGIVAAAIPLSWGPEGEIITVTADDFVSGRTASSLGFTYSNEEALPIKLLLRGAQTALIYRLDAGGVTASTTWSDESDVETYTITAKYPGTAGNDIVVAIQERVSRPGDYELSVVYGGNRVEYFVVRTIEDLINLNSDWVTITPADGITSIVETAGIAVGDTTVGTNGTINTADLSGFFTALEFQSFNTVCVYSEEPDFNDTLVDQVRNWSTGEGKYCQCVLLSETNTFDYEGCIVVNDGYTVGTVGETGYYEVTPGLFVLLVAGLNSGVALSQDLTSYAIEEAVDIITPKSNTAIENATTDGIMVLSYRQDRVVVIENDINSRVTVGDSNPNEAVLQRNQAVRTLYYLLNTIALEFNRNYSGKVANNEAGRGAFHASVNNILIDLENDGAIRDLRPADDIRVSMGDNITDVYLEVDIWPVSAMIKLYGWVTIYLTQRV